MAGKVKRVRARAVSFVCTLSSLEIAVREAEAVVGAILEWQERPFVYGESDCCQFVHHVYARASKHSFEPRAYQGEGEAAMLLAEFGGLAPAVNQVLERCHVARRWLRAGDLALCRVGDEETLGILLPSGVVVTVRKPDGKFTFLPQEAIECGWRID